LGRVMKTSRNQERRQTGCPSAREAVPERASPPLSSGNSPNSRSDQDRMGKDGTRRNAPAAPRERPMTDSPAYVGVDVAKDRLDVHCLPAGAAFAVANDPAGVADLVARLRPRPPGLVV